MSELPDYYFRVRDNGAAVFRLAPEARLRRIELEQIATLNMRNGEVKPQGDRRLSDEDMAAIRAWMAERAEVLARRDLDDILRTIDQLNLTAHWAQSRAAEADLDLVTDRLLLAMHDLRAVLVRKKADRAGSDPQE
ncbi:MAG: hypothetical protein JSR87_15210 [Proteobacteria bacterium]|nr:hypothetical protein [Pseudomonadota bacterium]MBS0574447.1 hypothetical protein [Pseudomonadota bacterium]